MTIRSISVIDSHTGGEPTRLVMAGGPNLGDGPLADRVQRFRTLRLALNSIRPALEMPDGASGSETAAVLVC